MKMLEKLRKWYIKQISLILSPVIAKIGEDTKKLREKK